MLKKTLTALLLLTLLTGCGATPAATPADAPTVLTATEAKARMDSDDPVVIVDVRTAEEYAEAHIDGAILVPNETIGAEPPALLPDLDAELLLYCRTGRRSAEAAGKLVGLGYTNVNDFGGIQDWTYETVSGAFVAPVDGAA
ncbi:MAG: rhodanese-like domain-containing protein [Oscillospiraceae bacterium]